MFSQFFFQDWASLARTAVGTTVTYLCLIVLLRFAGQRTLAKWYAFDLIVTVALGSTFANGVLSKDVSIAQSVLGFVMLMGLQFSVAWIIVHFGRFRTMVNPPPMLLLFQGEFQAETMRRNRVDEADVRAAVRGHGCGDVKEITAVILEADGTFSVIKKADSLSALCDVKGVPAGA